MMTWSARNSRPATNRRGIGTLPLLDYLVLAIMLTVGAAGYQHVSSVRNRLVAISSLKSSGAAVVLGLRSVETKGH